MFVKGTSSSSSVAVSGSSSFSATFASAESAKLHLSVTLALSTTSCTSSIYFVLHEITRSQLIEVDVAFASRFILERLYAAGVVALSFRAAVNIHATLHALKAE